MKYVHISWMSSDKDVPIEIFSEIGSVDLETRKIEIFINGDILYADKYKEVGTFLSYEKYPNLSFINEVNERELIMANYITNEEFENAWSKCVMIDRFSR